VKNSSIEEKKIAIVINATRDVSGSVPIELITESGEISLKDPFELFFKSSKKARLRYDDVFIEIKDWLWVDEEATKLSVFSHWTNADEIREWKTNIFKIFVQICEGEKPREFTIGTLISSGEIQERLWNIKIQNLDKYWLEWIKNTFNWDWYEELFQVWTWWWTHNVASTMWALLSSVKSDSLKIFTPGNVKYWDEWYTLRTSLLCHIEWLKICIRTDPEKDKIEEIEVELEKNKYLVEWIITTRPEQKNPSEYNIHAIPSHFDSNVVSWLSTLVFNWEDREIWKIIERVIECAEKFLSNIEDNLEIKTRLNNLLIDLKNREERLKDINETFFIEWEWFKDVKRTIKKHKWTIHKRANRSLNNLQSFLKKEDITLLDMIISRRFILKDILKYIVMINSIIDKTKNDIAWDTGKVLMITDWELWSLWVINNSWYQIFFENLILEIWETEKKLFEYLKKITSWVIDEKIQDTTWCGDSSITACMMLREKEIYKIRKQNYIYLFKKIWIFEKDYDKAISICEAFFMSTLQKIISWTVYHCRRSNLWDIPQSTKVSAMLLKYTFWKTIKYIQDWEKWIFKHLYSEDDSSSSKEKKYKWFNTYEINKN